MHRDTSATASLAEAGELPALQAQAEQAHQLWQRLFSVEGTAFTKTKLFEQAESMATLLTLIEHEQLRPALESALSESSRFRPAWVSPRVVADW